jgi:hypothetical protein
MPEKLDKRPLNFRLPLATLEKLDAAAKRLGLKRSVFLRELLEHTIPAAARFPTPEAFCEAITSMDPDRFPNFDTFLEAVRNLGAADSRPPN